MSWIDRLFGKAGAVEAAPVAAAPVYFHAAQVAQIQEVSKTARAEESTMSTAAIVAAVVPAVAAPVHVSFWKRLEAKAESLFHKLPKWEVVAADALKVAAPITEEILAVEDPALEAEVAPIITTIQTKLATAGVLIDGLEKSTSLASALADVQGHIGDILGLAAVKNSTSAAKIAAQLNLLSSVVASIQGAVGTPTAPGVVTATTPVAAAA